MVGGVVVSVVPFDDDAPVRGVWLTVQANVKVTVPLSLAEAEQLAVDIGKALEA